MSSPLGGAFLGVRRNGPSHPRPKPVLRNVRLEMPESELTRIQVSRSLEQRGSCPILKPDFSLLHPMTYESGRIDLYSPSPLIEFPPGIGVAFLYEVFMPGSAQSFSTKPPYGLSNPRFLLYLVSQDGTSQAPSAISINGNNIVHIIGDGRPIDITDLLQPMGQENWIIADPKMFCSPFVTIGVWANRKSLDDVLSEIAEQRSFAAPPSFDICPISRSIVNTPGRGMGCQHEECFDAACYITRSISLEQWFCPICGIHIPLDQLMVDLTRNRIPDKPMPTGEGDDYMFGFDFGS